MVERSWSNSPFGRVVCTALGLGMMVVPFAVSPADGGARWAGVNLVVRVIVLAIGLVAVVAVWTSRLVIANGSVTATNLFVSRSVDLVDVAQVEPASLPFFGLRITTSDGRGVRTLVSGQAWDEWWTPRATRIAADVEALAESARASRGG